MGLARRLFLNRAMVYAGELFNLAFPSGEAEHLPYHKNMRARLTQTHGLWLEPESLPGPRVVKGSREGEYKTLYLFSPGDLDQGPNSLPQIASLNADAYFLSIDNESIRLLPFYAFVGGKKDVSVREAYSDLSETYSRLRGVTNRPLSLRIKIQKPLMIFADFLGSNTIPTKVDSEVVAVGISVVNDRWQSPSADVVNFVRDVILA